VHREGRVGLPRLYQRIRAVGRVQSDDQGHVLYTFGCLTYLISYAVQSLLRPSGKRASRHLTEQCRCAMQARKLVRACVMHGCGQTSRKNLTCGVRDINRARERSVSRAENGAEWAESRVSGKGSESGLNQAL